MKTIQSRQHRKGRFLELQGLKRLPFLSEAQAYRLGFLTKQHKIDNRFAFNEDKKQ